MDDPGVGNGTFVVVKRKFLQLFLAHPAPAGEELVEREVLDGVTEGNEDVVVLAEDLERAMSKLPGHEAARASLFKQMMEATNDFKKMAEAAIDSDGFYVAHHVESKMQKNALEEEERQLRALYHRPTMDWGGDWYGYGYGCSRSYEAYGAYGGMDTPTEDDNQTNLAAGRAFLIEQSLELHRREQAAATIQAAWRTFKTRTAPIQYQPRMSETQQQWLRQQQSRMVSSKAQREQEWNPYVQPTTEKPYERSIHAVDAALTATTTVKAKPAPKPTFRPKLVIPDDTTDTPEPDVPSSTTKSKPARMRTVRWAAAEELSWIQDGEGGGGKTPYTAFASLHERVRQMSGPMHHAFAIPDYLLDPELALQVALQEARAAAEAAGVEYGGREHAAGWHRQSSGMSDTGAAALHDGGGFVVHGAAGDGAGAQHSWQDTVRAGLSGLPGAPSRFGLQPPGGPSPHCVICRAQQGKGEPGRPPDEGPGGRRSRRHSYSESGAPEPGGKRSRRTSHVVSEVFVPIMEQQGPQQPRQPSARHSWVATDPPLAPESRRGRRASRLSCNGSVDGEAAASSALPPGAGLESLGLPSPFTSATQEGQQQQQQYDASNLCEYHMELLQRQHQAQQGHAPSSQQLQQQYQQQQQQLLQFQLQHFRGSGGRDTMSASLAVQGQGAGVGLASRHHVTAGSDPGGLKDAADARSAARSKSASDEEEDKVAGVLDGGNPLGLQVRGVGGLGQWLSADHVGLDASRLPLRTGGSNDTPSKQTSALRRAPDSLRSGVSSSALSVGTGAGDEATTDLSLDDDDQRHKGVLVLPFLKSTAPAPPQGNKPVILNCRGSKSCGTLPMLNQSRAPGVVSGLNGSNGSMARASQALLRNLQRSTSQDIADSSAAANAQSLLCSPQSSRMRRQPRVSSNGDGALGPGLGAMQSFSSNALPVVKMDQARRTSIAGILSHHDSPVRPAPRFSMGGQMSIGGPSSAVCNLAFVSEVAVAPTTLF